MIMMMGMFMTMVVVMMMLRFLTAWLSKLESLTRGDCKSKEEAKPPQS